MKARPGGSGTDHPRGVMAGTGTGRHADGDGTRERPMTPDPSVDADRRGGVRLVAGALVAASRRLAGQREPTTEADHDRPDLRRVVLGAACVTEDRLRDVARAATSAVRAVGGPVARLSLPLVPVPLRRTVARVVRDLDAQGQSAAVAGTEEVERLARALFEAVGRDPNLLRLVEELVNDIQWQVVDEILPVVLERLAAEPAQVRAIVQGQSQGMVDELTTSVRSRAVTGDEAVDRFVARILRRRPASPDGRPGDGTIDVAPGGERSPGV
jgi:hypothetical protein